MTTNLEVNEENSNPRFTFKPKKDFNKGSSLVFLLHYYGQPLSDARYKVERYLAGEEISATLPDITSLDKFYNDVKKLNLAVELVDKEPDNH